MSDTEANTEKESETPSVVGGGTSDGRLERISSFTLTTLRLKQDNWQKMMAIEEFKFTVLDWLNNAQRRLLVLTLSSSGHLIPTNSLTDLCHNYAVHAATATATATQIQTPAAATGVEAGAVAAPADLETAATPNATIAASSSVTSAADRTPTPISNTTTAAVAASAAAVAASALLMLPLPPPSSSFSTLDGVPRGKCVFFVRRNVGVTLTAVDFRAQTLCGDLPVHSKIETLALLFDEVFQPLLECPLNRKLWPEIVSKDLHGRIKDVRNTLVEIKGKTNNRTILSLLVSPTIIEEVATHVNQGNLAPAIDLKFRSQLEEMFINWTTQIHEILSVKSECVVSNHSGATMAATTTSSVGKCTGVSLPAHEINFWTNRKLNLQNIYEQLRSPAHKSLAHILQAIDSPYYEPFAGVFKRLVCAWHEAEDCALWLQPLLRHTAAFNAVNFHGAGELIAPLVHVLHLIWTHARHYRSTQRMTVLLRCVCQLLVQRASEDLEFPMLFHGDADEGLAKITKTIQVLECFKHKMQEYKEKYASHQTLLPAIPTITTTTTTTHMASAAIAEGTAHASALHSFPLAADAVPSAAGEVQQLWRFSADEVFGHTLDGFLLQLNDMRKIFEAAVSFQNLEKLEIGGLRGKYLNERVQQIHAEFVALFEDWTTIEIDLPQPHLQRSQQPAAPTSKWRRFKRKLCLFFARTQALEQKLATVLVQAYEDCHNWEQLVKLTSMFGSSTLQRGTIQPELQVIRPHIFKVYSEELQQLEAIVHEVLLAFEFHGVSAIPGERNFPPTAGAVMWLDQHMRRCDALAAAELHEFI